MYYYNNRGVDMKNKGFTLIELLAVIIILIIITLIAVPIIKNIINTARENSYKKSIISYAKSLEYYIAMDNMNKVNDSFILLSETKNKIEYNGNNIECKYDTTTNDNLETSNLIDGKLGLRYCKIIDSNHHQISKYQYSYSYGKLTREIIYDYKIGDIITINNDTYRVIKNSETEEDYVVALKDKQIASVPYYNSETCGFFNGSYHYEGCDIQYGDSKVKTEVDKWATATFKNNELKTIDGYSARLLSINDLQNLNFDTSKPNAEYIYALEGAPDWLQTTDGNHSYWLMDVHGHGAHARIMSQGYVTCCNKFFNTWGCGPVRPVINIYKSAIKQS